MPRPEAPPCLTVGARVNPSTPIGLLESLLIFNEIEAECHGIVAQVVASEPVVVEYNGFLFRVAPTTGAESPQGEMDPPIALVRDVFGNPFRNTPLDSGWRTSAVLALAQAAYDNRTLPAGTLEPERLAVLADALEEASCDNAELLGHLRGPGPHVRGCFAVDLLLDKS